MLEIAPYTLQFFTKQPPKPNLFTGSAWRGALGHALKALDKERYYYLFETPINKESQSTYGNHAPHPFVLSPSGMMPIKGGFQVLITLTLLGRGIQHKDPMIEALQSCAQKGIYDQKFICKSITPPEKTITLDQHPEPNTNHIRFLHPVRLRNQQPSRLAELSALMWMQTLLRRYQQLDEQHSIHPDDFDYQHLHKICASMTFEHSKFEWFDWFRYSSRQRKKVPMGGVVGEADLSGDAFDLLWPLLWIGQWLHVGKGAAMGMGRYTLVE